MSHPPTHTFFSASYFCKESGIPWQFALVSFHLRTNMPLRSADFYHSISLVK